MGTFFFNFPQRKIKICKQEIVSTEVQNISFFSPCDEGSYIFLGLKVVKNYIFIPTPIRKFSLSNIIKLDLGQAIIQSEQMRLPLLNNSTP